MSKSLLNSCQLISDGLGTNDGPFRKSDFCDSDSSVDIQLIAFWSWAIYLILTIFCFCLSLLFLLFSFKLAHNCFRENLLFFFLQVFITKFSLLNLRNWHCLIFSLSLSVVFLSLKLSDVLYWLFWQHSCVDFLLFVWMN